MPKAENAVNAPVWATELARDLISRAFESPEGSFMNTIALGLAEQRKRVANECAAFCKELQAEYQTRFDAAMNETDYGSTHAARECAQACKAIGTQII